MAAWARDVEDESAPGGPALALDAAVFHADGRGRVLVALRGPRDDSEGLGRRTAAALRDRGAASLLATAPRHPADAVDPP